VLPKYRLFLPEAKALARTTVNLTTEGRKNPRDANPAAAALNL
jgi:hypothetical protein